ncbi:MAG: (Dimethylallyl)adenosine tRNA methylthiotransferase MiaB [bacterium ADurb.Bin363]|nr:MAG: (Dimethylallyl)adenosine tRNA methylthiotransferase MiaB [bacterium ADurb.Bin363]
MNLNDSEIIDAMMDRLNYIKVKNPEEAGLIIFNTCCVREGVDEKVYGRLGDYKRLKRKNPSLLIVVCGCLAQKDGSEMLRRAPHVDLILGPNQLGNLMDLLCSIKKGLKSPVHTEWDLSEQEIVPKRVSKVTAWVPISYGCDNFCSFCIVPYVRGRERSRPSDEILNEIKNLAFEGYKEITLLGQNVNTYGKGLKENIDFPGLLEKVNSIEGIERIRFTTSHPKDFRFDFIKKISKLPKVCEWFHLPLQAGDDEILKNMNRGYTVGDYRELIENIRKEIPHSTISTDLIVGFPGEREEQFENTLQVVSQIEYDQAFMFKYSIRSGTKAAEIKDQIEEEKKLQRLNRLIEVQNRISQKKNIEMEGKIVEILVEGKSKKNPNRFSGRTRGNKLVAFEGMRDFTGQLVSVNIEKGFTWGLVGKQI